MGKIVERVPFDEIKLIRKRESMNEKYDNFQNSDSLYPVVILNSRWISRYITVFLHLFQGPYPWPTLSPALNAATLPTPVSIRSDATGTLPPVTTPAKEPRTTVVCGLLCLTLKQNSLVRLASRNELMNCIGDNKKS